MLQEYKVGSILCWAVKPQNHSEKLFTTVSSTAETSFLMVSDEAHEKSRGGLLWLYDAC